MTKPLIEIHNITTNEVINREMTDAEFEQYQLDLAKTTAQYEAKIQAEAKKAALLERLGITAEEATLLLG
jgi:hypothetical protein